MEDFLCPVPECKKQFSLVDATPKTLQCLHTVCLNCLKLERTDGGQAYVVCPVASCRARQDLENGRKGLEHGLKTDYFIERASSRYIYLTSSNPTCTKCSAVGDNGARDSCETCGHLLCKACSEYHERADDYKTHTLKSVKSILDGIETKRGRNDAIQPFTTKQIWNCRNHGRNEKAQPVSVYCLSCKEMVCMQCALVHHEGQKDHPKEIPKEEKEGENIIPDLDTLRNIHRQYAKAIDDTDEQIEKLERAYGLATKSIKTTSDNLETKLLAEEDTLLRKVKQIHDHRMREIEEKMEEFAKSEKDVSHAIEFARSAADLLLPEDFLDQEKDLVVRLDHLCQEFENHPLVPSQRDVFFRSMYADGADLNGSLGQVYTNPDLSSLKQGFELVSFRQGIKTEFRLICRDVFGKPLPVTHFELDIAEIRADAQKFPIMKNEDGTFSGALFPRGSGKHIIHLEVRYDDHAVRLKPFTINVSPSLREEVEPENRVKCEEIRNLICPTGIALGLQYIAITDIESHRVFILSQDGQYVNDVGGEEEGGGEGEFKSPHGVDWWGENLVVADKGKHQVKVLSIQGDILKQFGRFGGHNGEFNEPTDVAVSTAAENSANIIVADSANFRVQIFSMASINAGPQFVKIHRCKNMPFSLSMGCRSQIYLVENVVHQFKILSPESEKPEVAKLSGLESKEKLREHRVYTERDDAEEQQLNPILGLTYDPLTQYVLLTELGRPEISVYDRNGLYICEQCQSTQRAKHAA